MSRQFRRSRRCYSMRLLKLIGSVIDREHRCATESDLRLTFVRCRQPKVAVLSIDMVNLRALDPEGRILCRLRFNPDHCVVLRIDPDASAIEKLAFHLRLD